MSQISKYKITKKIKPCEECYNNTDPISMESFKEEYPKYKIYTLKTHENNKSHCYFIESFTEYVEYMLQKKGYVVNPLNPTYTLNLNDFEKLEKQNKILNPSYKLPKFTFTLIIIDDNSFYNICFILKNKLFNCGVFPSFINHNEYLNSTTLLKKIIKLFVTLKILNLIKSYEPLLFHLDGFYKEKDYWLQDDGSLNMEKFISFINQI